LHLGSFVEVGLPDVIASVGRLEEPLEIVPLRPVAALLACFGLGFHFLVVTGDKTDRNCKIISLMTKTGRGERCVTERERDY
jgi:hypothetical protein